MPLYIYLMYIGPCESNPLMILLLSLYPHVFFIHISAAYVIALKFHQRVL